MTARKGNKPGTRSSRGRTPQRASGRSGASRTSGTQAPAGRAAPRGPSARAAAAELNGPWSSHLMALAGMFGLMGTGFLVLNPAGVTSRLWILAAAAGVATLLLYQTWRDSPRFVPRTTGILTATVAAAFALLVARALGAFA